MTIPSTLKQIDAVWYTKNKNKKLTTPLWFGAIVHCTQHGIINWILSMNNKFKTLFEGFVNLECPIQNSPYFQ